MKTFLLILLIVIFIFLLGGIALLMIACARGKSLNVSDPKALAKKGYSSAVISLVLSGLDWLQRQETEACEIMSYDGKMLTGTFVRHPDAKGTILLMHGWRSRWAVDFSAGMPMYYNFGYNLLLADQRSHSTSEGFFITYGDKESLDVESWVTFLGQTFGEDHPIILAGISMGASTVLMASGRKYPENVRCVIADCSFTCARDEFAWLLKRSPIPLPVKLLLGWLNCFSRLAAGFDLNKASAPKVLAHACYPVLLIHGKADKFVPYEMSETNFAACTSEKEIVLVDQAGHGMSYVREPERVTAAIGGFLQKHG